MTILDIIVPVFLLICLGYLIRKTRFLSKKSANDINRLVYYIALPALLFTSVSSFTFSSVFSLKLIINFFIATIMVAILSLIISVPIQRGIRGALVMCSFRGNLAYLGLPIVSFAFGEKSVAIAAILIGFAIPLYVVLSIILLLIYNKKKGDIKLKSLVKDIILNPLIIAVVLGLISSIFQISLPEIIGSPIQLISRISLPLILVIIGYSISLKEIKRYIKLDLLTSVIKLLVLPLAGLFIFKLLPTALESAKIAVVLLAMPTAAAAFSFAKELGADEKYTASQIGFSTIASLITIPLIMMIFGS